MKFGLLLPCKIIDIYDCTHYAVRVPGQSHFEIILAGVADCLDGGPLVNAVGVIERRISGCVHPVVWVPQPKRDVGLYRSIREGGTYLGDIILNHASLASYVVNSGFGERLGSDSEWAGEEWVGRWNL